mmetsp:Transcript_2604/g.6913  ORF Transcript_2604/g.6913 Transcript_2604/m.6913 type:complete len:283 (+) Transcript_2604:199-1047(+)|eukprot:CAMPEP_0172360702 /NCGR_PEP_ID=MMETSP1060-20121228/4678_1 /TAXON_ID=37318 /ORGANISM="Pseudo-nitzschia pungens, Strain cf. cingulata" /LENGTH=282 /DNA_ID=CAMNT_0013082767 /DNA_START=349 /DNA_END=1197 /DNA_ORIENTATION=+
MSTSTKTQSKKNINNKNNIKKSKPLRADGRASDATLRPLACELSCLHRPDGSALWKAGSTHVLAAVYGPIAPQNANHEGDTAGKVSVVIKSSSSSTSSSTSSSPSSSSEASEQTELGDFLARILEACIDLSVFPRCVIEVVLQVVQSDGSLLGCLLHGAVAALMDAGVDLLCLPVATTCLVQPNHQNNNNNDSSNHKSVVVRLDPTSAEEQEARESSIVVLVNEPRKPDRMLGSHTVGAGVSLEEFLSCFQIATKACGAIPAFWRLAMEQKLTRESQTLWSR